MGLTSSPPVPAVNLVPASPADAMKFLNGANPPAFAVPAGGGGGATAFTINDQAGDYTLVLGDAGKLVRIVTTHTLTIPSNASVAFPVGTFLYLALPTYSAGDFAFVAGSGGVTVQTLFEASVIFPNALLLLTKAATDVWVLTAAARFVAGSPCAAPQSSGNRSTALTNYSATDFSSIDPLNVGLNGLSTQVSELTDQLQAIITDLRNGKVPFGT